MISSRVPSPNLMIRLIRIALAALLVSIVAAPHASAQQELTFSLFERYLDALRVQANIPGISAAIVQDQRVVWATGLGFADVEHQVRARSEETALVEIDGEPLGSLPLEVSMARGRLKVIVPPSSALFGP